MFMFPDGRPFVLRFNQVEQRYYAAFVDRFPEADVSISQWRGGYEYQTLYPAIQMMVENGMMTLDALNEVLGVIAATNQSIYRPAVLQSRVAERFAQAGYEATARVADINTRGILAICVDQVREQAPPKTLVVGENPNSPGLGMYQKGLVGSLSNPWFRGAEITVLGSDDLTTTVVIEGPGFVEGVNTDPFEITSFVGAHNFAWDAARGLFKCSDASLAPYLNSIIGQATDLTFTGETVPVNGDDGLIGNLIRDEMLPSGQHMEGDVIYPTALSNGQAIGIRWTVPIPDNIDHRVTITRKRGSPYPENTVDEIIGMFLANFDEAMGIGSDLTPQVYLTVRDIPWASSVLVEWSDGVSWHTSDLAAAYNMKYIGLLPPANVVIV